MVLELYFYFEVTFDCACGLPKARLFSSMMSIGQSLDLLDDPSSNILHTVWAVLPFDVLIGRCSAEGTEGLSRSDSNYSRST